MLEPSHGPPFSDFDDACAGVLAYLRERFGHGRWVVTRSAGRDEIVLRSHGSDGPHIGEGELLNDPIATGTYVGVPLEIPDGRTFGRLCAIDERENVEPFEHELPAIRMYAQLLSTILARELEAQQEARRAARAEDAAMRDPLTGLLNRRAWDLAVVAEEDRCRRYGSPAAVISLDVDGLKGVNDKDGHNAGDELLRRAGEVLLASVRRHDTVARLGGDEFAILLPECPGGEAVALASRVREKLCAAGVAASVGCATRPSDGGGLAAAYERADARMYETKRGR